MMWQRVKRSFSISAPKLSVRPHIAWYLRWSLVFPFVLAALALAWWAYGSGLELAGFHRSQAQEELAKLRGQVAKLSEENVQLNNQLAQLERQIQIEQASNQEAAKQLKSQAEENGHLQEDLAFFQNLTATRGKEGELGVHRLKLERDSMPGEYHVRMLLVQSGQRAKAFSGNYQLVVSVVENGVRSTKVFPQGTAENAQFQLNFKYYQRIEQSIQLPQDVRLENVQVRIFEQGMHEPKLRQSVDLS
jgi:lipopolysaccharide export LptBFGC system permease protein LptF